MKCLVCGNELNQMTVCQVCGEKVVAVVGDMTDELQKKFTAMASNKRRIMLSSVSAELRSYYWKDVDGELVERSRQDIPIVQNMGELDFGHVVWGNTEYARQTAGEELTLNVVIKYANGYSHEEVAKVVAPGTSGLWRVGCVLKPGLRIAIRVGNEQTYSDSEEINLKG